jgi:hypothetical protein
MDDDADTFRDKAAKARRLADLISDKKAATGLRTMAEYYEAQAVALDAPTSLSPRTSD